MLFMHWLLDLITFQPVFNNLRSQTLFTEIIADVFIIKEFLAR